MYIVRWREIGIGDLFDLLLIYTVQVQHRDSRRVEDVKARGVGAFGDACFSFAYVYIYLLARVSLLLCARCN